MKFVHNPDHHSIILVQWYLAYSSQVLLEKNKPICGPLRYNILREIDRGLSFKLCSDRGPFKVTCKRKGVDYPVIHNVFTQF